MRAPVVSIMEKGCLTEARLPRLLKVVYELTATPAKSPQELFIEFNKPILKSGSMHKECRKHFRENGMKADSLHKVLNPWYLMDCGMDTAVDV